MEALLDADDDARVSQAMDAIYDALSGLPSREERERVFYAFAPKVYKRAMEPGTGTVGAEKRLVTLLGSVCNCKDTAYFFDLLVYCGGKFMAVTPLSVSAERDPDLNHINREEYKSNERRKRAAPYLSTRRGPADHTD